ncbi:hypothetical protein ACIQCM_12650 [Pseudarthrobacter sp. NPDC092439]|uniref:hypothetical protein n=1 Tax=unclassified Pseudarthrobacter TaxID=2647000 RepID=UPI00381F933A
MSAAQLVFQGAWVFVLCGTVLLASVAGTALVVRRHAGDGTMAERPDQLFWDVFLGAAVAIPALLIPTLMAPPAGLLLGLAATAAGIAAYRGAPRLAQWREQRRNARLRLPLHRAAQVQHQELLARWRRYELDPACAIDYPGITDVRLPETSALIRAMRDADLLAGSAHPGYPAAVAALAESLAAAERAAGAASGHARDPERG